VALGRTHLGLSDARADASSGGDLATSENDEVYQGFDANLMFVNDGSAGRVRLSRDDEGKATLS
jgi:hypothetical protein